MSDKDETKVVSVRLDKADYDKLQTLAAGLSMPFSKLLRMCLHMGVLMAEPMDSDIDKELAAIVAEAVTRMGKKEDNA